MKLRSYKHLVIIIAVAVATLALYLWFITTPQFTTFKAWSTTHLPLFITVLFILKIFGLVWPPIPGGVLTLGSIPVLGWKSAYAIDFFGSLVGSSIAYFLARRYGLQFMRQIFDKTTIEKIKHLRIVQHREIEAIFLFRVFGGTLVELVCYAAGLLRVRYSTFLIGTIASHILVGIPVFYFAENLISKTNLALQALAILVLIALFFIARTRYIVREEKHKKSSEKNHIFNSTAIQSRQDLIIPLHTIVR